MKLGLEKMEGGTAVFNEICRCCKDISNNMYVSFLNRRYFCFCGFDVGDNDTGLLYHLLHQMSR